MTATLVYVNILRNFVKTDPSLGKSWIVFSLRTRVIDSHTVADFFTMHYDHPVIDDGILLRDMLYYRRSLCRDE